jgi:hypothetical protein
VVAVVVDVLVDQVAAVQVVAQELLGLQTQVAAVVVAVFQTGQALAVALVLLLSVT